MVLALVFEQLKDCHEIVTVLERERIISPSSPDDKLMNYGCAGSRN
jgi:hypothetical protein